MMYHAQEKIVNVPGSEITGQRGGIHNSVTRTVLKPTHMIGGYAQLSYGFNYYGTVGSNRDEFVIVRKMAKVDWLDHANRRRPTRAEGGRSMKIRAQIAMVLNLDKCIGCHTCSVTCKNVWTITRGHGIRLVQQCRDQAGHRLSQGLGEPEALERRLGAQEERQDRSRKQGGDWRVLANIFANPDLPEIDDYYEPFTFDYEHLQQAPELPTAPVARPLSLVTGRPMDKIEWGPNWEEILGGEFDKRSQDYNFEAVQKDIYGQFENTFMMYLPRLCEHCLNPSLRRLLPLRLDLQARGGRHRPDRSGQVPRLAHVRLRLPVQEDLLQLDPGKAEKCIFCYPRIEAGQPTVCSETCVGRIRYLGVLLYDADGIERAAATASEQDLYEEQLKLFLDPNDPAIEARRARTACPKRGSRRRNARPPTRWRSSGKSPFRFIRSTGRCRWSGMSRRCRRSSRTPTPARSRAMARFPTFARCESPCVIWRTC